jgi:malate dehydrogenase
MPKRAPIRIAVTGAAGHVGYSLLPRIALGLMFGPDQPIELRLIEIPQAMKALEAVVMELHDCVLPLMESVSMTDDLGAGLEGANWVVLCGSAPREGRMERKALLGVSGQVFASQGKAIMAHAAADVRTLVVGNPCNTNCLVALSNAQDVPADRWFAMTRLDENRAKAQLALKAGAQWTDVTNLAIWGNHSATAFPDFLNARIAGRPATDVISDRAWLEGDFIETVQRRGAVILEARGLSAAQSAAQAAVETIHSIVNPTPVEDWHSVALPSDGSYGIEKGIVCSFPTRSDGSRVEVVQGVPIDDFARARIDTTIKELVYERAMVQDHIPD